MTQTIVLRRAADHVLQIERAMRRAQLWQQHPPTPAAMASRTPFCADTLSFSQWLQFVFLPRMHLLIEAGQPLPESSDIATMAEHCLPTIQGRQQLLAAIRAFDDLIAAHAAS